MFELRGPHFANGLEREDAEDFLVEPLRRYKVEIPNRRILDFGCGGGATLAQIVRLASGQGGDPESLIGVDADKEILELAQLRLQHLDLADAAELRAIEQNDELDFIADESLDLIVCAEVFEHVLLEDRQVVLDTLWSKLSSGGLIYISAPTRLSPFDRHTTGLWFSYWLPPSLRYRYARRFSARCRRRTDRQLQEDGISGFSYWQLKRLLGERSYVDLAVENPVDERPRETDRAKALWVKVMWPIHRALLRYWMPFEAVGPRCAFCIRKVWTSRRSGGPQRRVS